MIRPGLSVEEAESELVDAQDHLSLNLSLDNPYINAEKERALLLDQGLRDGLIEISYDYFGWGISYLKGEESSEWSRKFNIYDALKDNCYFAEWGMQLDDYEDLFKFFWSFTPMLRPQEFIYEQLVNALEHGSDWCTVGNVTFDVKVAVNGVLAIIEQPKPGSNFKQILEDVKRGKQKSDFLYYNSSGRRRGAGTWQVIQEHPQSPWIWDEELKGNEQGMKCRTIILETRERILNLQQSA
jgi:hypothetical protein